MTTNAAPGSTRPVRHAAGHDNPRRHHHTDHSTARNTTGPAMTTSYDTDTAPAQPRPAAATAPRNNAATTQSHPAATTPPRPTEPPTSRTDDHVPQHQHHNCPGPPGPPPPSQPPAAPMITFHNTATATVQARPTRRPHNRTNRRRPR